MQQKVFYDREYPVVSFNAISCQFLFSFALVNYIDNFLKIIEKHRGEPSLGCQQQRFSIINLPD